MKPWAQAQIDAAKKGPRNTEDVLTPGGRRVYEAARRNLRTRGSMLRCCGPDCTFENRSSAQMDAHCDAASHHRYELVLP